MKPAILIGMIVASAGCTNIPELEGSEAPSLRTAPYPVLIPLSGDLSQPANPKQQATDVEEELASRSEALAQKAQDLQDAQIN